MMGSHMRVSGNYYDCLCYPKFCLARTPQANKNRKTNNGELKKQNKILNKIEKDIKQVATCNQMMGSHMRVSGNYYDCLCYPKFCLARTPQALAKTIVVKHVRNLTINANASGNVAFMFLPQAIPGASNQIHPLFIQNAATYTPSVIETTVGWVNVDVGAFASLSNFSGGRCLSAYIKLTPNLSMTTAQGRGLITCAKINFPSVAAAPTGGTPMTTNLANLTLQAVQLNSDHAAWANIVKLESLVGEWLPQEAADLLVFPVMNQSGITMAAQHPNENAIVGLFTGLPNLASINVEMVFNHEYITTSDLSTSLYPLLAEFSKERNSPIQTLGDVYRAKKTLVRVEGITQ